MILKEGDIFLLSHENGDIDGTDGSGLYHEDTRYLSRHTLRINGQTPPLLGFSGHSGFIGSLWYANDMLPLSNGELLLPQTLSIKRSRFSSGWLYEMIEVYIFSSLELSLPLLLEFGSDFRYISDIRGFSRNRWGERKRPGWDGTSLLLRYVGADEVERSTR